MPKTAIVVVGARRVGKSRTLMKHLNPRLGISERSHKFTREGRSGYVKTQSLQEAKQSIASLKWYSGYDILVIPSWPDATGSPSLDAIRTKLEEIGFSVAVVNVRTASTAEERKAIVNSIIAEM